jgi:nicotinate dehydrogenase subunit B
MNENEYIQLDFSDITTDPNLTRREFIKSLGGGIIILFCIGDLSVLEARRRGRGYPEDFNAYLRIGGDGRVTCFTGKVEYGQGIITSLAQMLAEELDVAAESVDMIMGDTTLCPWDMGTFGSMSTRFFGPPLRAAGAQAKAVLMELASEQLGIPADRLVAQNGVIFDKNQKTKQVTYAQLAEGKTITREVSEKGAVKKPSEFKVMGKSFSRRDALDKVQGKAMYSGDIQLPDMLYAKILRPPAHGAKLTSVDTSAAEQMKGIRLIRDGDMVAVLGKSPDLAEKALGKIKAQFDVPQSTLDDKNIFEHLLKQNPRRNVVDSGGDLKEGQKLSDVVVEEKYLNSYVAHAPMETHTAAAKIEGNKVTVWASTQTPFPLQDRVARALGISSGNVRIITPFIGGAFGGKSASSQAIEAAKLAKLTGKPVQVIFSRAEEFFYDTFRPAAVVKIKSGMKESGKMTLWDYTVYFAGSRGSQHFYDIPNHSTVALGEWRGSESGAHPFAIGPWRAPGNNTNSFARESQIDVMASRASINPLEFRLKNLKDERMKRVLKTATEKAGWTPAVSPSRRGFGIACGIDSGTYVALVAEARVDEKSGKVQVKRVVCAQDMGIVVNPEGAVMQIEGCITMGLGYALTEEIHFKGGEILDTNFGKYELPRFSWLPQIESVLIKADDISPQGGGEPAIICMGAVIANAIYDATGARLLQLPMTPERVKQAIAAHA